MRGARRLQILAVFELRSSLPGHLSFLVFRRWMKPAIVCHACCPSLDEGFMNSLQALRPCASINGTQVPRRSQLLIPETSELFCIRSIEGLLRLGRSLAFCIIALSFAAAQGGSLPIGKWWGQNLRLESASVELWLEWSLNIWQELLAGKVSLGRIWRAGSEELLKEDFVGVWWWAMVLRNEIEVDGVGEVGAETVGSTKLILIRKSDSSTALLKQDGSEGS